MKCKFVQNYEVNYIIRNCYICKKDNVLMYQVTDNCKHQSDMCSIKCV